MITAAIDLFIPNPGPHPSNTNVVIAECTVQTTGTLVGEIYAKVAELNSDGSIINEWCQLSMTLPPGVIEGIITNQHTGGCSHGPSTGTIRINKPAGAYYYGIKTWGADESEPSYPVPDYPSQPANAKAWSVTVGEVAARMTRAEFASRIAIAGGEKPIDCSFEAMPRGVVNQKWYNVLSAVCFRVQYQWPTSLASYIYMHGLDVVNPPPEAQIHFVEEDGPHGDYPLDFPEDKCNEALAALSYGVACTCTAWINAECTALGKRRQTRTCEPAGCDIEEQFIDDPACASIGDITAMKVDGTHLPEGGTVDWIVNAPCQITLTIKNVGVVPGTFDIKVEDEEGTVLCSHTTPEIAAGGSLDVVCGTFTPTIVKLKTLTASINIPEGNIYFGYLNVKPKAVTCDSNPYASFGLNTGCKLLRHYDADNDGLINLNELNQSYSDSENGVITEEEFDFVSDAYIYDGINVVCPGCWEAPPTITVTFVAKKGDGSELTGVNVYIDEIKRGET